RSEGSTAERLPRRGGDGPPSWPYRRLLRQRRDEPREDIGLKEDEDADRGGERDAVPEDVAQDLAFVALLAGGDACHDDALGVDHLSHDAAAAVGGTAPDGTQ